MTSDEQGKVIDDSGEVVGFFVSSIVAKRAVACMTALAHVTDKQMESGELLHMGQAIKDLTKQRDELLAALDTTVKAIMIFRNVPMLERLLKLRSSYGYGVLQQAMDIGREAIACVRKSQGKCYYAPDGTLMNPDGTRSIFDDVDQ